MTKRVCGRLTAIFGLTDAGKIVFVKKADRAVFSVVARLYGRFPGTHPLNRESGERKSGGAEFFRRQFPQNKQLVSE